MTRSLFFLNELEMMGQRKEGKFGRGRKIDPNSVRQKTLAEKDIKKANGVIEKRGRPVGSKNVSIDLREILMNVSI